MKKFRPSEMAQLAKTLVTKPVSLSSIPGTCRAEGEVARVLSLSLSLSLNLCVSDTHCLTHTHTHAHTTNLKQRSVFSNMSQTCFLRSCCHSQEVAPYLPRCFKPHPGTVPLPALSSANPPCMLNRKSSSHTSLHLGHCLSLALGGSNGFAFSLAMACKAAFGTGCVCWRGGGDKGTIR